MEISGQVVSLKLAKEMKRLGFPQDSLWYWHNIIIGQGEVIADDKFSLGDKDVLDFIVKGVGIEYCAAPTVAEMGEKLINLKKVAIVSYYNKECKKWVCQDIAYVIKIPSFYANTEANARAKMGIYLKKEGLL